MSSNSNIRSSNSSTESAFIKGAMILSISMVIVKTIGFLYKIVFAYIFDGVANGIFNIVYELYNPLFMLATAGFPIAISRMVSESVALNKYKDVKRIHKVSIPIFLTTGIFCFLFMIFFSNIYVGIIDASAARLPIYALAPTIFFGCLVSIYRGYYEGMRNMVPTAISEIIEATSKLVIGLSLAFFVSVMGNNEYQTYGTLWGKSYSDELAFATDLTSYTVAAAILGVTIGSLLAFLFLFIRHRIKGDRITKLQLQNSPPPEKVKTLRKRLILTAIPIGLGAIIMSISGTIDTILVQSRIIDIMNTFPDKLQELYPFVPQEYFEHNTNGEFTIQIFLYGSFSYATTLLMLITAVTQVFGTSALPNITAAWTTRNKKKIKRSIETVLKTTTLFTLPAGLSLCFLAGPILNLIYGMSGSRDVEIAVATPVLQVMGISALFIATSTPICSMLQAVGRVDLPLKLLSIGMVIKILLNYTLVGIPEINIQGAAVGSLVGYLFVTFVGLYLLCKETKIVPNFVDVLIKPLIAALVCATSAFLCNMLLTSFINSVVAIIISISIGVIMYVISLFVLKALKKSDILMLPKGNKIVKVLEKKRLIR